ncbi:MAG: 50S ribosomal protein L23 [Gammaproteobacteria bacterium]
MVKPHLFAVIEGAHISEKASTIADQKRQFTFRVAKGADKPQIKSAVEELFKVQVSSVSVLNIKGKRKGKLSRNQGKRSSWKKAYVTLKPGSNIDFTSSDA